QKAGQAAGFDGNVLFFQDAMRSAPFDPSVTVPGALASPKIANRRAAAPRLPRMIPPATVSLAQRYHDKLQRARLFEDTLGPRKTGIGSNWWVVAGWRTDSGFPMLASDPHLSLSTPPIWYEAHLSVANDPQRGVMNVAVVSLPGAPGIILGCNDRVCWGATVNPMDVTDWYQEHLVVDLATMTPKGTMFGDGVEPVVMIPQTFRVNQPGNGVADDLT